MDGPSIAESDNVIWKYSSPPTICDPASPYPTSYSTLTSRSTQKNTLSPVTLAPHVEKSVHYDGILGDTEEDTCEPRSSSAPVRSSLAKTPRIPTPSIQNSPSLSPSLLGSRPARPQHDPAPGNYWLFDETTKEWVQRLRWLETSSPQPPDSSPPYFTKQQTKEQEGEEKQANDCRNNPNRGGKQLEWTGLNEKKFYAISNWRFGQRVALISESTCYILPNITDWVIPTPTTHINVAVQAGRVWIASNPPYPYARCNITPAPDSELGIIKDLKKPGALLVALEPPEEQTAGTIYVKGARLKDPSKVDVTKSLEARPRKRRKNAPTNIGLVIPSDLNDLRAQFPDKTIALFLAVLVELARQGNIHAGSAVAAFNNILNDKIACLPTKNELEKFRLHGQSLIDRLSTVAMDATENTKTTPAKGGGALGTTNIDNEQQDSSLQGFRYRDSQGYTPPPALHLPPSQPKEPQMDSAANLTRLSSIIPFTDSNSSIYTFIITGSKMSGYFVEALAHRWLAEANKRIDAIGTPVQLKGVRVDNKHPTERIITAASALPETETKEQILQGLKGWKSIEVIFHERDCLEWVVTGVPSKNSALEIAENISRLTGTTLGPRRPTFLTRGAATSILRFSTVSPDKPGNIVSFNGHVLHIKPYNPHQDSKNPVHIPTIRNRQRKHMNN